LKCSHHTAMYCCLSSPCYHHSCPLTVHANLRAIPSRFHRQCCGRIAFTVVRADIGRQGRREKEVSGTRNIIGVIHVDVHVYLTRSSLHQGFFRLFTRPFQSSTPLLIRPLLGLLLLALPHCSGMHHDFPPKGLVRSPHYSTYPCDFIHDPRRRLHLDPLAWRY